jgi:hypothetical protein
MRQHSFTAIVRAAGLLAAILLALYAGFGPSALAHQDAPGNNGTVKVHEGAGEPSPSEVRNEPHVCTFHLHFYFADPVQAGSWEIQEWAPTGQKGTVVLSGTYDTAGDGEDRQPEHGAYSLPDGHYKLFWDGDTGKHDKMKVFWVECAPTTPQTPAPTGSELPAEGSPSVSPTGSELPAEGSPSASPTGSEQPAQGSPSTSPSGSQSESPSPTGSELPAVGTPPAGGGTTSTPGGAVLGAVGTPPATDTASTTSAPAPSDDGWRVVALGLSALIVMLTLVFPSSRLSAARVRSNRR